jgi:hypothetical protein
VSFKACRYTLILALIGSPVALAACADEVVTSELTGTWGGEHIRLVVKESRATLVFDCASGTMEGPLIPDEEGKFEIRGTYRRSRGGPGRPGMPEPKPIPALYRGWTDRKRMRLSVTLLDTGSVLGPFSLGLGQPAALDLCM